MLLQKLEGYGVDVEMVEENLEFVKGFLAGAEAVRGSTSASSASSSVSSAGSDDGYGHYSPEPGASFLMSAHSEQLLMRSLCVHRYL